MKSILGIDVSKNKLDIAIYDGTSTSKYEIDNSKKAVKSFLKKHKDVDKVIMEGTGTYFLKAAYASEEEEFYTSVVNPYRIKAYREYKFDKAKTDKVDAVLIAMYGYENETRAFKEVDKQRTRLKKYINQVNAYQKDKTANKNRIESIKQMPGEGYDDLIKSIKRRIKITKDEISKLRNEINKIIKNYYKETYELLTSINGVGTVTASVIIAYYEDFSDFDSAKKAIAYAGLNPTPHQSGSSLDTDKGISKRGNGLIRKRLYMGALSAAKCNPQCIKLKERLEERGKCSTYIYTALAHKLLRQAYGVVTSGVKYDPDFLKKAS
jgi:transposase